MINDIFFLKRLTWYQQIFNYKPQVTKPKMHVRVPLSPTELRHRLSNSVNLHQSPCLRWTAHHPCHRLLSDIQRCKVWTEKPGSVPDMSQEGSSSQPRPQNDLLYALQRKNSIWNEYHRSFCSLKITCDQPTGKTHPAQAGERGHTERRMWTSTELNRRTVVIVGLGIAALNYKLL